MALISCPECKQSVSDQAPTCPTCGYPIKKPEYKFVSVTYFETGRSSGLDEYGELLKEGWQVVDTQQRDLFDGDGHCYAGVCEYKLQR